MAYGSQLKPFVFDQEGLFARKSSSNILSDPRILEHLRIVAEEAQFEEADEENISDEDDFEFQRKDLEEKIAAYNKRNQFGAFRIVQNELNYEGAVRFYFEDGNQELTKAVRITDKTTVADLLPVLLLKFNFLQLNGQYVLYVVHEVDEIALDDSDCPLTIAISALKIPRFVLRLKSKLHKKRDSGFLEKQNSNSRQEQENTGNQRGVTEQVDASNTTSSGNKIEGDSRNGSVKHVNVSPGSVNTNRQSSSSFEEKSRKAKRTRSFSHIASMVRKKKNANKQDNTELSTYKLAPGILKVFGDHVSPGSNYKSVRASTISTAKEVVKQALEKYGLEHANPNDFVLCDVVGHFKVDTDTKQKDFEEAQWVTEYVRVVNDNEKPLVVQSLWKPAAGRLRRFELIKKIEMETSFFFINTADNMNRDSFLSSPSADQTDSERSSIISTDNVYHKRDESLTSENLHTTLSRISSNGSKEGSLLEMPRVQQQLRAPKSSPFLMLLKGYNAEFDNVIYPLEKNTICVGTESKEGPSKPDICLHAPDLFHEYCFIHRKISIDKGSQETNIDEVNFSLVIDPAPKSEVFINGVKIEHATLIIPGQILSLGNDYCFLFKNPSETKDSDLKFSWLDSLKQVSSKSKSPAQTNNAETQTVDNLIEDASELADETEQSTINNSADTTLAVNGDEAVFNRSSITVSYKYDNEDELLDAVIHCMDGQEPRFRLTPAYMLTMMTEHSCASFSELRARKLLLKISSALQGIAWEKTKEIGKKVPERKGDVIESLTIMISELEPVVLWMSNALEMLHYLQCHLNRYLGSKHEKSSAMKESLASADEELLTVLEEVIMFTFQQTVYHLTKILYSTLPAILDANPFQKEDDMDDEDDESVTIPPGVALIIEIFQRTLSLVSSHNVHPQIIVQLFAYLFFFTNASLFNSLMERGTGGKFYRWIKGVQIRGNMDVLEDWASQSGLQEQFGEHMRKIIAAVALLSLNKAQLLQMEWNTIRDGYPDLNASQVQQLLGEYQLGAKGRPRGWYPPPEEVEAALRTSDVLESFATHPPLLLPTNSFMMDLNNLPEDETFSEYLNEINKSFGIKDEMPSLPKSDEQHKKIAKTPSSGSTASIRHEKSGQKFSVSIQPSHTSTPQKYHITVNAKEDIPTDKAVNASPRSSSDSSSTMPIDQGRRASFDGDADVSEDSSTPRETPEFSKKSILKKDEVMMQHRQHPSPPPQKKTGHPIERDIEISDDQVNNEYENEERKSSNLGSTKSIQIAARRSPNASRRADNLAQMPKSDMVYVGSRERKIQANGVVTLNGQQDYINTDDQDVVADVDFTSNSHIDTQSDEVFIVDLVRGDKGLGLGLIDGLITPLVSPGIYIRTVVTGSPAAKDGRIKLGDRILAVNGTSLVGSDYSSAMEMIINAGNKLSFLVAKSDKETIEKIISSQC